MRKLSVSEWCCAVRFNKNNDSIMTDLSTPFVVLPNSKRYWCADPFLFQKDDHYFVFFEAYDRLKRKGVLGYRQITEHTAGDIHIICESTSHLSYPFIYEADGNLYIVPESNMSGELYRFKCLSFPNHWEKEKVLMHERLVDSTFFPIIKSNIVFPRQWMTNFCLIGWIFFIVLTENGCRAQGIR